MKLVKKIVTCSYDANIAIAERIAATKTDDTGVNQNQEDTGFLAVTLDGDNSVTHPTPKVKLAGDGDAVYGALATINTQSNTCGVITEGIVPMRAVYSYQANGTRNTALVADDLNEGVVGDGSGKIRRGGQTLTGSPPTAASYTDGTGRGLTVGKTGEILWVDLSTNANVL